MPRLLEVTDLRTVFASRQRTVTVVDGLSFGVDAGKTLGIVGESGSGKSVTMLSLLGLLPRPQARVVAGSALFAGQDLLRLAPRALRDLRGKRIAMIFQDPLTALNPYLTIGTQLAEVLTEHDGVHKKPALARAAAALDQVGLPDAERLLRAYPHQLSGGMRQRVMIAMAIIGEPELLIADEPTTALDVTVQAQVLELLGKLQRERGMGLVLITHDLGVVAGLADELVVMYAGRAVEQGPASAVFARPSHPYTRGLLASIPRISGPIERLTPIPGLPPDLARKVPGCAFAPRCAAAKPACVGEGALPERFYGAGHKVFCHEAEVSLG